MVVIIQQKGRNRLILIESCERLSVQIYAAYAYAIQSVLKLSNNVVLVGDHLYLTQLPFVLSTSAAKCSVSVSFVKN